MNRKIHQIRTLAVVLLLALSLGACDSDSPTAPSVTPSSPPATTASSGSAAWVITLTVDPPSVSLDDLLEGISTATIVVSARRSDNGQLPPEGSTAVLTVTRGQLLNNAATVVGTSIPVAFDSSGRAFASFNFPQIVGDIVLQARFEQSVATARLQVTEEDFAAPLFIESVLPNTGPPAGGTVVRIQGSGFDRPVRVTIGGVNATVQSVSSSLITAVTPPISLPVGQTLSVAVSVTINVNDPDPEQVTATDTLANAFTYARAGQTDQPSIISVSPTSGPNEGGTLVTIQGENFANQVQVFFGTSALIEAPVIDISSTRLLVETPSATGPNSVNQNAIVDIRVVNTESGLFAERAGAFQYGGPDTPVVFISAAGPGAGLYLGGTTVTIFGQGFDEPVAVEFGGFGQQVISVTGTEIVARSVPVAIENCNPVSGPFGVVNIETGEGASSSIGFTYLPIEPVISSIVPNEVAVVVETRDILPANAVATIFGTGFDTPIRVLFGDVAASIIDGSGVLDPAFDPRFEIYREFDVLVPPFLGDFDTDECTTPEGETGTRPIPTPVSVTVINLPTDCTDTFPNSFSYRPVDAFGADAPCVADSTGDGGGGTGGDPPVADFSFTVNNLRATFTDLSTGSPTSWLWDFGDPGSGALNTSTEQNPVHDYPPVPAMYTVTLTATNEFGSDTFSADIRIDPSAQ